ncbi:MAG: hypothetical protein K0R14_1549 [Burkholderiales bacterium]|nr:hypothetical protein [Burkholderiales bacterium]
MRTNKMLLNLAFGSALLFSGGATNAEDFLPLLGMPVNTSNMKVISGKTCLPKFKALGCNNTNDADINNKCFEFYNPIDTNVYKLIKTEDDLESVFGVTGAHASLTLSSASVNLTEGHFKKNQSEKSKKMSLIFYNRYAATKTLTQEAMEGIEKVNSPNTCGGAFISQNTAGIVIIAEIEVDFVSVADKISVGGDIKGNFGDKVEIGGVLDYLKERSKQIDKVSMYFYQEGGDAMGIAGAVHADSMLGCNFNPNVDKCKDVIAELKKYTEDVHAKYAPYFNNPKDMWKIPFYYSGAVATKYNDASIPKLDPELEPYMKEIIRKKDGLIGISTELSDVISKITGAPGVETMKTTLSRLKTTVDEKIASMDGMLPPYNGCFGVSPTLDDCKRALDRAQWDLSNVFKAMAAYKAAKPTLMYTVDNLVLLPKENGEGNGHYNPEETSCYMIKTALSGDNYRLYCPSSDPVSPGTVSVEFKTDDKGKKVIDSLEINTLNTCTTGPSSEPGKDNGDHTCAKIEYYGDITSSTASKTIWKWNQSGDDSTTITPTGITGGLRAEGHDLFEKPKDNTRPARKIKPIIFTNEYDGNINWERDLSDKLLEKKDTQKTEIDKKEDNVH